MDKYSQVTSAEMVKLSEKLTHFSASLNDNERALFKQMFLLDRTRLSTKAVGELGGDHVPLTGFDFQNPVPKLDARFFQLMCW